jgi:hypothetical protein
MIKKPKARLKRKNPNNKLKNYIDAQLKDYAYDTYNERGESFDAFFGSSFLKYEQEQLFKRIVPDELKEAGTMQLKLVIKIAKDLLKVIEGENG